MYTTGGVFRTTPQYGRWSLFGKSKSKSKKTVFNVGQYKQYNISYHLKWVLVADGL